MELNSGWTNSIAMSIWRAFGFFSPFEYCLRPLLPVFLTWTFLLRTWPMITLVLLLTFRCFITFQFICKTFTVSLVDKVFDKVILLKQVSTCWADLKIQKITILNILSTTLVKNFLVEYYYVKFLIDFQAIN